eukprot:SAG31_NODE_16596_length_703_cov_0.837748_2_plen_30_part_01
MCYSAARLHFDLVWQLTILQTRFRGGQGMS